MSYGEICILANVRSSAGAVTQSSNPIRAAAPVAGIGAAHSVAHSAAITFCPLAFGVAGGRTSPGARRPRSDAEGRMAVVGCR